MCLFLKSKEEMSKNNSNDVPLRREGYTQVKGLIESIENDRNADAFREPVDWEGKHPQPRSTFIFNEWTNFDFFIEMGLLDYPQIVKNPMDLATCKEKLLSGKYPTYEEVFGDIQLIWDNCKLYNMIGCEIYKICERMEKTAKRQIQKFRAAHGLPQP